MHQAWQSGHLLVLEPARGTRAGERRVLGLRGALFSRMKPQDSVEHAWLGKGYHMHVSLFFFSMFLARSEPQVSHIWSLYLRIENTTTCVMCVAMYSSLEKREYDHGNI
jgi:hypothetical protein